MTNAGFTMHFLVQFQNARGYENRIDVRILIHQNYNSTPIKPRMAMDGCVMMFMVYSSTCGWRLT